MRLNIVSVLMFLISIQEVRAQQPWDDDDHQLSLTIPEMSLLTITPTTEVVKLVLNLPGTTSNQTGEAGTPINNATWVNYSTSIEQNGSYKKLMVQITSGDIPKGLAIELTAEACTTGKGKRGTPVATITLSKTQQTLISSIGGSCTGKGKSFGHNLIYELILKDLKKLEFDEPNTFITVTFTISD